MREIRPSGSEGGGAAHAALPTPIKKREGMRLVHRDQPNAPRHKAGGFVMAIISSANGCPSRPLATYLLNSLIAP